MSRLSRKAIAAFALAVAAVAASTHAQEAASVCNGMKVDLADITFDGEKTSYTLPVTLPPGACAVLPDRPELPNGAYVMRVVEKSGRQAAMCVRKVQLAPGLTIRITPDDGAQCLQ
jgi:hypothetical protein